MGMLDMIKLSVQIGLAALLLFVAMAPTVDSFQTAIPPRVCQIAYKETGINFCGTEPRIKDAKGNLKYPGQVCSAYDTHQVDLWVQKNCQGRKGQEKQFPCQGRQEESGSRCRSAARQGSPVKYRGRWSSQTSHRWRYKPELPPEFVHTHQKGRHEENLQDQVPQERR